MDPVPTARSLPTPGPELGDPATGLPSEPAAEPNPPPERSPPAPGTPTFDADTARVDVVPAVGDSVLNDAGDDACPVELELELISDDTAALPMLVAADATVVTDDPATEPAVLAIWPAALANAGFCSADPTAARAA